MIQIHFFNGLTTKMSNFPGTQILRCLLSMTQMAWEVSISSDGGLL